MPDDESNKNAVQDALTFAQSIAREEIAIIERLHYRTLKYIAWIGGVVLAIGGILTFIGYANLKSLAVATAKAQMRQEVTDQVREKLKKEDIEKIVREQVQDYSTSGVKNTIHKELSTPPISVMLRNVAADEARNQIKVSFRQACVATSEPR